MIAVILSSHLRARAAGAESISLQAGSALSILDQLFSRHPALRPAIVTRNGGLQPFVRLFHNGRIVAPDELPRLKVNPGDEIRLVSAVAGG